MKMSNKYNIWVVCPNDPIIDYEHTYQLLGKAVELRRNGEDVISAIFIGMNTHQQLNSFIKFGADEVLYYRATDNLPATYIAILVEMIKQSRPNLILFPATWVGKKTAAILATIFKSGLTSDCIDIRRENTGDIVFSRAAVNQSIIADIKSRNSCVEICTVKRNVFAARVFNLNKKASIRPFQSSEAIIRTSVSHIVSTVPLDRLKNFDERVASTKMVFGLGRGVYSAEARTLFFKVAELYGAYVGGTRAAVEQGYICPQRQIGQSGSSISPPIYIAVGISGASQHMVGVRNSKMLIAINCDPDAPIFSYSDIGIVGDCEDILRELYLFKYAHRINE